MGRRIAEYLQIEDASGQRVIRCAKCAHVLCPSTDNYKDYALMSERPPTVAGPRHHQSEQFVLREFYCPGCATMLDVEMCLKGAPFVQDLAVA